MPSLTTQLPSLREVGALVEVSIALSQPAEDAMQRVGQTAPTPVQLLAQIDTGASATVIQQDVVPEHNLQPVRTTKINTPSSTNVECYLYPIRIVYPHALTVPVI